MMRWNDFGYWLLAMDLTLGNRHLIFYHSTHLCHSGERNTSAVAGVVVAVAVMQRIQCHGSCFLLLDVALDAFCIEVVLEIGTLIS